MSDDDFDTPEGRGNYRAEALRFVYERARREVGLSSYEMRKATRRYPFEYRPVEDLSTPQARADYKYGLYGDVLRSAERYSLNPYGYSRVYGRPGYEFRHTGYRRMSH